ncbi:MAG: YdcF family protein, partial [Acidimicrobiia bacterium]|nr:YdcF family protein [Acidimicrobiia bacterium]
KPSPVFAARLDHALELWKKGVAPLIVVTGGKQPGDRFTEASSGANYLLARGVPDSAILRETTSRNSWESLAAAARFLKADGISRVTLVSDPFHMLRAQLIAQDLGLEATTSSTQSSPISGIDEITRYFFEAARVSVGRVFGFDVVARRTSIIS